MQEASAAYTLLAILLGLIVAVFYWLYLCMKFDRIIKDRHPDIFESMGRPHLVTNNTTSNNVLFIKFLFREEWKNIEDVELGKLSHFMKVYLIVYLTAFLFLVVLALAAGCIITIESAAA